jgi:uncharacterized membrane protein YkvI
MARSFGAAVLVIAILFSVLTTIGAGLDPERFAEQLGLKITNAGGTNEIRAQYAGFFFAVAVVCAVSLAGALSRQTAFMILAAVFGGLFVGRLVSLALNGGVSGYGPTIRARYGVDSVGFALALAAAILNRAS